MLLAMSPRGWQQTRVAPRDPLRLRCHLRSTRLSRPLQRRGPPRKSVERAARSHWRPETRKSARGSRASGGERREVDAGHLLRDADHLAAIAELVVVPDIQ